MADQEYILEDDFLDDLDAACQPPSVVTPNSRVRAPSASILAQLSPAKPGGMPLSSPERLQSPTKLRKSPLSVPSPQRSPLALGISKPLISRPIDLDLSDDSSTEQDEVILVGVMPTVRPPPQPSGPLLQISSLAPLRKPTRLQLANRQKRIDLKRESLLEKLLVPNASASSSVVRSLGTKPKPTLQPTLDAYFNVKPLKRPQTPKSKKPFEPAVEVINLATSSNLFWCRPIEPFGAISHSLNSERPFQSVQCDHLSCIPWKTLCSQSSYVAALINPPWEQSCSVESFKESLQPLTTMLLPTGGFLFWWIENEFLGDVFHLCKQWHFHHVENMCWVRLNVDNTISRRRPTHGAVCNQSKLSLFIFRKTGDPIKLRHQRNVDVHFEMDRHWLQHHSKPYEYVYQLIETLLPAESEATGPRFLEIWARPHHTRPGWTSVTLPDKPELVHVEDSQESLPGSYTTATVMAFPEPSLSQLEASQGSNRSVLLEQRQEDTIALNEEELEALLSQRGSTKLDPEQTILLDNWDHDEDA